MSLSSLGWLLQHWRGRAADIVDDASWADLMAWHPLVSGMTTDERERLRDLTGQFLRSKVFEPVGGLELNATMQLRIALPACVPILNLGIDYYRHWYSVVVYPAGFVARHEYVTEDGVVHSGEEGLVGEAWEQGPVVLAWEEVEASEAPDGFNVVIHEFAHKLDSLTGSINGLPPLHRTMSVADWSEAWSRAYDEFTSRLEAGQAVPLDEYAAESPAEFFAVLSESFFSAPSVINDHYPHVYRLLALFYRQDPLTRYG